ncbi:MAG: hypothetical protein WCK51_09030 [Armatimonadota bacterium]
MQLEAVEQPVRLTVIEGGLRPNGETELPYSFDLKNLFRNLMNESDQMTPSEK